jgi:uncharacterized SAM-binding protein YcdF (DUF218 family)
MDMFRFWKVDDNPPENPGCFIVLSYAVENAENPTKPTREIIKLTSKWWKKFPKSLIIMSTGDNQQLGVPNSQVMVKYAVKLGIPGKNLFEEDQSRNTVGNLINSLNIAKAHNCRNITLVLYDLHVRRTLAIAHKLNFHNLHWISVGSSGSPAYGIKALQTSSRFSIFIYELFAYGYNLLSGQI